MNAIDKRNLSKKLRDFRARYNRHTNGRSGYHDIVWMIFGHDEKAVDLTRLTMSPEFHDLVKKLKELNGWTEEELKRALFEDDSKMCQSAATRRMWAAQSEMMDARGDVSSRKLTAERRAALLDYLEEESDLVFELTKLRGLMGEKSPATPGLRDLSEKLDIARDYVAAVEVVVAPREG